MKAVGIYRWALAAVLVVALVLRLVIVFRGGQFFWADETRYIHSENAWKIWETGAGIKAALLEVLGGADHLGFKVMMLFPAWVQRQMGGSYLVPSTFVSLFSLMNILWVWLIARRAGGDEREAFWAAAAMACANSMFYWSRHLMPYDLALWWALACLYVGIKPEPKFRDSILAGGLGCMAFVTYNGYWAVVACALTAHVLMSGLNWWSFAKRVIGGLAGLIGMIFLLLEAALRWLDVYLLESYLNFSGTITQGEFHEGARVFFDYLWRAEGGTALVWAAVLLGFGWLARWTDRPTRTRGILWAGSIVALMGVLIIGANVLEKFVVYGRLARQVAPFFALLLGWTAGRVFRAGTRPKGFELAALVGLVLCGAWSMTTPIRQKFPVAFRQSSVALLAEYRKLHPEIPQEKFKYLYVGFIWPEADRTVQPPHEVLLESPHPLAWRPYLYEGFNRAQRDQIEATDIRMRLILLKD